METGVVNVIDHVVARVREHWRERKVPMLLSTLGSLDSGEVSSAAKRYGKGLRAFLEAAGGDRLMIVEHSERTAVIGVVPREEETEAVANWDSGLEALVGRIGETRRERLHPALWAAFKKPLRDGMERYVHHEGSVGFRDVEALSGSHDGVRLDRCFIVGLEASPEEVYGKAVAWLKENELEVSMFRGGAVAEGAAKLPSNDLLGKLIVALGPRDLEKISMSMDVVAKLRRLSG